jgi:hypothetical protein
MQACEQFALPMTSDRRSSTFLESWSTCRTEASPKPRRVPVMTTVDGAATD